MTARSNGYLRTQLAFIPSVLGNSSRRDEWKQNYFPTGEAF